MTSRQIAIIGAPLCDGEREKGVEKAPNAIRAAGLVTALNGFAKVTDHGDIDLRPPAPDKIFGNLRNAEYVVDFCRKVKEAVSEALRADEFPVLIGGDCSIFPGAVAGLSPTYDRMQALYLDGHADFNTEQTTVSGYFSGMALAAAVGKGYEPLTRIGRRFPIIREEDVCVVGLRRSNLELKESKNLEDSRIRCITAESIKKGAQNAIEMILDDVKKPTYLHVDLDVIDPQDMPALAGMHAGVHSQGGLSYEETKSLLNLLKALPMTGMEITLYDPTLDQEKTHARRIIQLIKTVLEP